MTAEQEVVNRNHLTRKTFIKSAWRKCDGVKFKKVLGDWAWGWGAGPRRRCLGGSCGVSAGERAGGPAVTGTVSCTLTRSGSATSPPSASAGPGHSWPYSHTGPPRSDSLKGTG